MGKMGRHGYKFSDFREWTLILEEKENTHFDPEGVIVYLEKRK
jgi:hypothetical protein